MKRSCPRGSRLYSGPLFLVAPLAFLIGAPAAALQDPITEEKWLSPPPEIAEVVLAPRHRNVTLDNASPDGTRFLHTLSAGLPTMASFAKPHLNLGGLYIDPRANRARNFTTRGDEGFEIIAWREGTTVRIPAPRNATVSTPRWSPDGSQLAYFAHFEDATHIFVADARTGRTRQLTRSPVLATLATTFEWTADGRGIVTVLVPENRGREPRVSDVPTGPRVRITQEGRNRLRTYASLLETPEDMALLEYHTTGQLALIDVGSRSVRRIGKPAMIREFDISPDGQYVRVTTMRKPFSYIVPVSNFGRTEEVWDLNGNVLAELAERPLQDGTQQDSARNDGARRNIAWRPDGQGLSFLQLESAPAGDQQEEEPAEGDRQGRRARRKDRVMQWLPPFDSTSLHVVFESDSRISNVRYSADARILFVTESSNGTTHEYAVFLDDPSTRHTIARYRNQDVYAHPGTLMTRPGPGGVQVVRTSPDGNHVFLSGTRYFENPNENAPRPFIDRMEIRTGQKTRIFESAEDVYEEVLAVLDDDVTSLVISRESPTMVPDSYHLDLTTGELRKLTENRDYSPEITNAQRRLIEVTRVDGIKFWVTVVLPPDWRPGSRLPALFWFYPREYTDQAGYDRSRRTYNKNRFPSVGPRSMEILTRAGYAVVLPDAPIIGPQGRMNDRYIPDLRNNLAAVIDELDRQGLIDRTRLGLGGHSYGAFSTVNAMVHTPFFKAGIAGDGNYNRLLTPIGFQTERRELWEARETYLTMSPLLFAEQLNGALLMYHGMDDQNVGTHPINSIRLFHALNGLGKTAALYLYPYEDHGPATRETLLDLWARWVAWLDRYVKNADASAPAVAAEAESDS